MPPLCETVPQDYNSAVLNIEKASGCNVPSITFITRYILFLTKTLGYMFYIPTLSRLKFFFGKQHWTL